MIYNPLSKFPFRLSRSKIDLFTECPRCFYLDRKIGVARPSLPGWPLNSAVDALLKKEFDLLREKGEIHALMKKYKINALPFRHPELNTWRDNFKGKEYLHQGTNLIITGAVDDIWIDPKDTLYIVDYKSTSTEAEISLDDKWKQGYKRQLEIYQWIFRKSGFKVSDTGYFVFANADKGRKRFDGKLEFALTILDYKGDSAWVEPTIFEIKKVLDSKKIPASGASCEYCAYTKNRAKSRIDL